MKFPEDTFNNLKKQKCMTTRLFPIREPHGGKWLKPEVACRFFKNGKGIRFKSLMNKLYAGKLGMYQKNYHTGFYVWVSDEALNNYQQLHAA